VTAIEAAARPHPHQAPATASRIRPEVPTLVLVAAAAVLLVNVVVMFLGAWVVGPSWDEPVHADRLATWFQTEWYVPSWQMTGGSPTEGTPGLYVYGPVAALLAHGVAVLLGAEGLGQSLQTADAYAARHLAIALMAVVGVAAVAGIVRLLVGSWRWALVAAAALSCIPTFTGHGMFNIKDVPVATGYTLVTLGAVALSRPTAPRSSRLRLLGTLSVAGGVVLTVGTRPGMWVPVLATLIALPLITWAVRRGGSSEALRASLRAQCAGAATGAVSAYVVLLLVYPRLFGTPAFLLDAVKASADYPWQGFIRTNGIDMAMPPPRSYLFLWFGAQTPLVLLALAVVGAFAAAVLAVRALRRRPGSDPALATGVALVLVQALLMPAYAIVTGSVLYDGTRQVLFVLPALAALSAVGAWWLLSPSVRTLARPVRVVGWTVLVAGLVVPTATSVPLYPYTYSWFNAAAAARPIDGRWMTDYWRTSAPELLAALPAAGRISCIPWTKGLGTSTWACDTQLAPNLGLRGTAPVETAPLGPGEYYLLSFNRGDYAPPPGCAPVLTVARPLLAQSLTMSALSRCQMPLAPYPVPGGITTGGGAGDDYLMAGWYPAGPLGVWSGDPDATMAFRLPEYLRDRPLTVSVAVGPYVAPGSTQTVSFVVNGTTLKQNTYAEGAQSGTVVLDVPADLAWSADGRMSVAFSVPKLQWTSGPTPRPLGVAVGRVTVKGAS